MQIYSLWSYYFHIQYIASISIMFDYKIENLPRYEPKETQAITSINAPTLNIRSKSFCFVAKYTFTLRKNV